jgi:hypothetical protein
MSGHNGARSNDLPVPIDYQHVGYKNPAEPDRSYLNFAPAPCPTLEDLNVDLGHEIASTI